MRFFWILFLWLGFSVAHGNSVKEFFVELSDATEQLKQHNTEQAKQQFQSLKINFNNHPQKNSPKGKIVQQLLNKTEKDFNLENLINLSKSLIEFEKEQHPIDYEKQRKRFQKRVIPAYEQLVNATNSKNITQIKQKYKNFTNIWALNEAVVRSTSKGHYGKIETSMAFFNIAMNKNPADFNAMNHQLTLLNQSLNQFISGEKDNQENKEITLSSGLNLLTKAQKTKDDQEFNQLLTEFIQSWPVFEGDVRTKNAGLYNKIESELPLLIAQGNNQTSQNKLSEIVGQLQIINPNAGYNAIDAMLILLREGVEALIIIITLISALKASGTTKGKKWVYLGAIGGIIASVLAAVLLSKLLPSVSAGKSREFIEGIVGIIAVIFMLFVGAWLHNKSSITGWQDFINKSLKSATKTGNLFGIALLSFLVVFREGAETVLFYAGILPKISLNSLIMGILLAIILLIVIAFIFNYCSKLLPIHRLFKIMTWLIYVLGFKILGVSVHILQLNQQLPYHPIASSNLSFLGLYLSFEGLLVQLIYLALIPISIKISNRK